MFLSARPIKYAKLQKGIWKLRVIQTGFWSSLHLSTVLFIIVYVYILVGPASLCLHWWMDIAVMNVRKSLSGQLASDVEYVGKNCRGRGVALNDTTLSHP
jgi:hypothetical protein